MKQIFVEELKQNANIIDFFMVKMIGLKTGGNNKIYLDLKLGDKTGEVNSKKWDVADDEKDMLEEIKEGDLVKVKASVTDWQNQKQLRVTRIRKAVDSDGLKLEDFVKAAPENPVHMYEYILDIIGHIAYLAGLADADEPATPEALLAGFDVRTLPQRFPDRVQILWR